MYENYKLPLCNCEKLCVEGLTAQGVKLGHRTDVIEMVQYSGSHCMCVCAFDCDSTSGGVFIM
jgi:hypothetical protein